MKVIIKTLEKMPKHTRGKPGAGMFMYIPSGYLTLPWEMAHLQMVYLLKNMMFHGYMLNNQMVYIYIIYYNIYIYINQ